MNKYSNLNDKYILDNMPDFIEAEFNVNGCLIPMNRKVHEGKYVSIKRKGFCRLHRYTYWHFHGKCSSIEWIEKNRNKVVMHKCDNPNCINPNHLALGTQIDNINDRKMKNRCACGESNGYSKLTQYDVDTIRHYSKERTYRQLSDFFGVNRKTIYKVIYNKSWQPLPTPPEAK